MEAAGGVCAICGQTAKLVLDHCHTTGKLRGALCEICNVGLSAVEARPGFIKHAELYLQYWSAQPMTEKQKQEAAERIRRWEHINRKTPKPDCSVERLNAVWALNGW